MILENEDELVVPRVGPVVTFDYEVMPAAIGDDGIANIHYVVTELLHNTLDGLGVDEVSHQ